MNHIVAPYNFVPVAEKVWHATDLSKVSHDHPLEDGYSGTLDVELTAQSPLYIRDGEKDNSQFFRQPDGTWAVPGSSLRGMLRNVVEIATFSALNRVNDHRYAVRDLRNRELYVDHVANIASEKGTGKKTPMPLVGAGWFVRSPDYQPGDRPDPWTVVGHIYPCNFAKMEYAFIEKHARNCGIAQLEHGTRKQSGPDKYKSWTNDAWLDVDVSVRELRDNHATGGVHRTAASQGLLGEYSVVTALGGRTRGRLVFTGQPAPYKPNAGPKRGGAGNPKHHDFVFYAHEGLKPIPVLFKQLQDFEFVHADRGEQNNLGRSTSPNAEWKYWSNARFENNEAQKHGDPPKSGVPVFYLFDKDRPETPALRAFGLAMMFRLAYRNSVRDGVPATHLETIQVGKGNRKLDMATALFGYADESKSDESTQALRGRVAFSTLAATDPGLKSMPEVKLVLGTPKASYYPNYVEQRSNQHGALPYQDRGRPRYRTFMDDDVRIRGWKRYHALDRTVTPPAPVKSSGERMDDSNVATRFAPLPAGTRFRGKIRFHNLSPVELGALLWSLDFGGSSGSVHRLGMAKPLGYGNVTLTIRGGDIRDNATWTKKDLLEVVNGTTSTFSEDVDAWCKREFGCAWSSTVQLQELLNLSTTVPARDHRHMLINNGDPNPQQRNEFTLAKSQGWALSSTIVREGRPNTGTGSSYAPTAPAETPYRPTIAEITKGQHIARMKPVSRDALADTPTLSSPSAGKGGANSAPAGAAVAAAPAVHVLNIQDAAEVRQCVPASANTILVPLYNKYTNTNAAAYSADAEAAFREALEANKTMMDWLRKKGKEKFWAKPIVEWLGLDGDRND
jgi:CRISPR-associated protein (TIGR03986 family)